MTQQELTDLWDETPIIEVDDYAVGFAMAQEIANVNPELKAQYLARWAARLRQRYVQVGRVLEELSQAKKD